MARAGKPSQPPEELELEDDELDVEDTEINDDGDSEESEAQPSGPAEFNVGASMRSVREAVRTGMKKNPNGGTFIVRGGAEAQVAQLDVSEDGSVAATFETPEGGLLEPVVFENRKAFYTDLKTRWSFGA